MIYGTQYRGMRRVNQINGQNTPVGPIGGTVLGARSFSVPVNAAYQTALSVSGRGVVSLAALYAANNSVGYGLRVTIDGRQIFAWSGTIPSNFYGICAVGSLTPAVSSISGALLKDTPFLSSLLIEALSTTASGALVHYYYEVDQ